MSESYSDIASSTLKTEEEVFEINDFTNSSDWEKFISDIEEVIYNWHLTGYVKFHPLQENEFATSEWQSKTANISFSGVPFLITLNCIKEKEISQELVIESDEIDDSFPHYVDDMMNAKMDFPSRAHYLARWFGLRCFLVLSIAKSSGIASQSKCNLLSSSAAIALRNTSCDIPFFVQIQENWRRVFAGQAVSSGISTEFELVHLKKIPMQYHHLSGLLSVFRSKIGLSSLMFGSIKVSARFTYILNDWGDFGKWPSKQPDSEALSNHFGSLLCGCYEDPVSELQLAVTWPSMIGDMVVDNDVHSYFKPLTAPSWSIRLFYTDEVLYLLSSYLVEFFKITDRPETLSDLLNVLKDEPERHIGQALSKITEPQTSVLPVVPGITKVVTDSQVLIQKGAYTLGRIAAVKERMSKDLLTDIKNFLFLDSPKPEEEKSNHVSVASSTYALCHKLKAAPINSLTYRVAVCATVVNICHGGLPALAQFWHLFISELRNLLDSGSPLPAIEGITPDFKTCLLHQKLQMLNYCINCKRKRENTLSTLSLQNTSESCFSFQTAFDEQIEKAADEIVTVCDTTNKKIESKFDSKTAIIESTSVESFISEDSDEEFFECENVKLSPVSSRSNDIAANSNDLDNLASQHLDLHIKDFNDIIDGYPPEGRLKNYKDLNLLCFDRPMFIPIIQEHSPMTEDLLEEQAEVFSKLGDTKEGSKVRAKMQSASLLSDMQAFKAANPGCCLEDFLRWYSPKDFEAGKLSERMLIPDNLWVTTWKLSKPVPVFRQKRLFDDTKEAEKVLHFLANLKPGEVAQLLLPVCTHEALLSIRLISESMAKYLPSLPLICDQIEDKASKIFRGWKMHGSVSNQFQTWDDVTRTAVNDLFSQISFTESLIERSRSLRHKFAGLGSEDSVGNFVRKLLEHPEVTLDGGADGAEGKIVRKYFKDQQRKLRTKSEVGDNSSDELVATLPEPAGKEFILRASHPYPTSGSREMPHRLYAVMMRNEFRLASAVSSDSTFF